METQRRTILEEAAKLGRLLPSWLSELLPREEVLLNLQLVDLIGYQRGHIARNVQHS